MELLNRWPLLFLWFRFFSGLFHNAGGDGESRVLLLVISPTLVDLLLEKRDLLLLFLHPVNIMKQLSSIINNGQTPETDAIQFEQRLTQQNIVVDIIFFSSWQI